MKATFTIPYIAHAPLEPRAAVAEWSDGKLTVWTGTQRPFGVRDELVAAFRLKPEQVRVLVPDTGSGYGGKHTGDAAIEAAALAKAGVGAGGKLLGWEFHNYNSGAAALQAPYAITDRRERFHAADSPLRQGSYRALAATANHFARESAIDDLAAAAGVDPLTFRRQNHTSFHMCCPKLPPYSGT